MMTLEQQEKLVDEWTTYALCIGCGNNAYDVDKSYADIVKNSIGFKQFILKARRGNLSEAVISDIWDMVRLNINSVR